jgi:hypothetical protein
MKISIDIDCTPEEARAFLGLPEVAPFQAWMMQQMQERMSASLASMGVDEMMKAWMPPNLGSLDLFRDFYGRMLKEATGQRDQS